MERWKPVDGFENYHVSSHGRVTAASPRDRMLSPHRNQRGILSVILTKDGKQYRRSVAGLVARAFVPSSEYGELFDTPMHLDGDKDNCLYSNLVWRPRWFAIRYHRQFKDPVPPAWLDPVVDLNSGITYDSLYTAAVTHGFLMKGLFPNKDGMIERVPWPTNLKLMYISQSDTK